MIEWAVLAFLTIAAFRPLTAILLFVAVIWLGNP